MMTIKNIEVWIRATISTRPTVQRYTFNVVLGRRSVSAINHELNLLNMCIQWDSKMGFPWE